MGVFANSDGAVDVDSVDIGADAVGTVDVDPKVSGGIVGITVGSALPGEGDDDV